jgi:hypothetical protein
MKPMPEDWATAVAVVAHPDDMAGYVGLGAGCQYALGLRPIPDGLTG